MVATEGVAVAMSDLFGVAVVVMLGDCELGDAYALLVKSALGGYCHRGRVDGQPGRGGDPECLTTGWSVVTADGSLPGHDEHTVAVTEGGPEDLLTLGD